MDRFYKKGKTVPKVPTAKKPSVTGLRVSPARLKTPTDPTEAPLKDSAAPTAPVVEESEDGFEGATSAPETSVKAQVAKVVDEEGNERPALGVLPDLDEDDADAPVGEAPDEDTGDEPTPEEPIKVVKPTAAPVKSVAQPAATKAEPPKVAEKPKEAPVPATKAPPPKLVNSPVATHGKVSVERHYHKNGVSETTEVTENLEIKVFSTFPAKVGVQYSHTINLGDYSSAKIGVSVEVPSYVEEMDAAFVFAAKFAEERMAAEVASIKGHPAPVTAPTTAKVSSPAKSTVVPVKVAPKAATKSVDEEVEPFVLAEVDG